MIFQQMKNIDTAFKYTRTISFSVMIASVLLAAFALHTAYALVREANARIYVLAGSKAIEAISANRRENIPVEARDHIRSFHEWFFTLDPDEKVIGANSGPVFEGARVFQSKGCLNCHLISGDGGRRGPDLTYIGDTLSESDMIIRIVNGGVNMPAYGNSIKPEELAQLTAFLQSRKRPMPAALEAADR